MNIEKERSKFELACPVPAGVVPIYHEDTGELAGYIAYRCDVITACRYDAMWYGWRLRAEKAETEFNERIDAINERSRLRVENEELRAQVERLRDQPRQAVPDGWRLVPMEPVDEQIMQICAVTCVECHGDCRCGPAKAQYIAGINAAPQPPSGGEKC